MHTPGPWFVARMYEGSRTVAMMRDFIGQNVALAVHGPQDWIHAVGAAEQIQGNADLIAAAPDLLAALKAIVEHELIDGVGHRYEFDYRSPLGQQARAAIAKAEGRQP